MNRNTIAWSGFVKGDSACNLIIYIYITYFGDSAAYHSLDFKVDKPKCFRNVQIVVTCSNVSKYLPFLYHTFI